MLWRRVVAHGAWHDLRFQDWEPSPYGLNDSYVKGLMLHKSCWDFTMNETWHMAQIVGVELVFKALGSLDSWRPHPCLPDMTCALRTDPTRPCKARAPPLPGKQNGQKLGATFNPF